MGVKRYKIDEFRELEKRVRRLEYNVGLLSIWLVFIMFVLIIIKLPI